ncbi:MAG TPA: hypothetical protein VHC22_34215 [Pirellulales bacterium]|nr:hypothetical protein [Pirellulales bacterium]
MSVEARLTRLESQNRWLRRAVVVAVVGMVLPWVMGGKDGKDSVQDVVRSKSLQLVDNDGEVRGGWSVAKDGLCKFTVYGTSQKGAPAIMLMANADGASVQIERDGHIEWARPPRLSAPSD